jgi:uracil-DNA glycosylase
MRTMAHRGNSSQPKRRTAASEPRRAASRVRFEGRPISQQSATFRPRKATSTSWNSLVKEITGCTKCPLSRTRAQVVVYRGSPTPFVLFVGEAPGTDEDRKGQPFVGRAGKRLDQAVKELRLSDNEVGFLNLIKCHPPNNRFDRTAERECRPYLERQLEILRPGCLVTLGSHALRAFAPTAGTITNAAGTPILADHRPIFPLFHPAASLHNPRLIPRWKSDLSALQRFLMDLPRQKV